MGLFDFFRRKPTKQLGLADDDGPSPEYIMAHYALRQFALAQPLQFLGVMCSPKANEFLQDVLKDVEKACGKPAPYKVDDLKVHRTQVHDYPTVIIVFPEPSDVACAHMVAVVALFDMNSDAPPDPASIKGRYFTLEKGMSLDATQRTVFAEWSEERHSNYGDGPLPKVEAFADWIEEHLKT